MPTDMASLLSSVHPISYNVKARTGELLEIIKSAKATANDGPSMMEVLRPDSVGAVAASNARLAKFPQVGKQSVLIMLSADTSGDRRSDQSAFWGGAFGSSTWEEPSISTKVGDDIKLAIPLPPLASEAFSDGGLDRSILMEPAPELVEDFTPVVEEEAFTIKGGKKRKSEEMDVEQDEPSGEYDISLNEEAEESAKEKAQRKAERKAQKKALKAAKRLVNAESPGGATVEAESDEPFDYSKAESVLNKKKTNDQSGNKRQKKPFDPYQKSADAPKGMRRLQTERPGRSITFKG
jgi:exosome complex exonuclease RRP6